jgi:hypothetical protein
MAGVKRHDYLVRGDRLTRGTPAKDRRAAAIHEAGHAVMAHVVGEQPLRLVLVPGRPRNGYTETAYFRRGGRFDPLSRALVALAGHEAEHRVFGRPLDKVPYGDWRTLVGLGLSPITRNLAGRLARQIVRQHESAIRKVAKALLVRGRLDRRGFLAALRS